MPSGAPPLTPMAREWSSCLSCVPELTTSCPHSLDPVQVTQMAKYLETVYVSGWQSSSTAPSTNEPGPDLAGQSVNIAVCSGS